MNRIHDTKELGRAIRARRRELGYTQAFLAEYAGVSASFLSELENGKDDEDPTKKPGGQSDAFS